MNFRFRRYKSLLSRVFRLLDLFQHGEAGGLYSPLTAFQDVDAAVRADDAGETVALIADQHTTVETLTTFRTWDFSAGVDGATATNGTLAANIDSILGRNDCLRLTVGASGGATYYEFTLAFFGTTRNRLVISVDVPAAQTYVDGFRVYAGDNSTGTLIYDGANNGSTGAWVDIDVTKYVGSTTIRVYAYIGTSATISASGSGSLMYVRGMVSSYTNLLNLYQPVLASRPPMGSYPNVPGGLGIRNRIRNNTMVGAVAGVARNVGTPTSATRTASTTVVVASVGHNVAVGDMLTCSGASVAAYNGTYRVSAVVANVSFSYVVASSATDSATGFSYSVLSPGTLATNWSTGVNTTTGIATIVAGSATEDGINYTDIRFAGLANGAGSLDIFFEQANGVAALTGQVWAPSFYARLVAGGYTGLSSLIYYIYEYTAALGFIVAQAYAVSNPTSAALRTQRNTGTVTLSGGATTAFARPLLKYSIASGALVDITLRIGTPQLEKASAATAVQLRNNTEYQISEAGYPSVLMPYGSGSKMLTTGVVGFGAATQGFLAAVGQNWTLQGVLIGFGTGVIAAQTEQAADANQMFNWRATATAMELVLCGTVNTYTATPTSGGALKYSIVCTNGVVTVNINGTGRQSATVGAGSAESVYATFFARNNTTPAAFYTGFAQPVDFIDKAQSVVEESSFFTTGRRLFGGV